MTSDFGIHSESNVKEDLKIFIEKSKRRLDKILETFGWTKADVLKKFRNDPESFEVDRMLDSELDKEPGFPASFQSEHSVVLDIQKFRKIVDDKDAKIPVTFSDLQLNFKREQKLAIYDHIIKKTGRLTEPEPYVNSDELKNFAAIVSAQKQEKRKCRKHRKSKLSYIEEVRSLVETQMMALQRHNEWKKHNTNFSGKPELGKNKNINKFYKNSNDSYESHKSLSKQDTHRERSHHNNSRPESHNHWAINHCNKSYESNEYQSGSKKRSKSQSPVKTKSLSENFDRRMSRRRSRSRSNESNIPSTSRHKIYHKSHRSHDTYEGKMSSETKRSKHFRRRDDLQDVEESKTGSSPPKHRESETLASSYANYSLAKVYLEKEEKTQKNDHDRSNSTSQKKGSSKTDQERSHSKSFSSHLNSYDKSYQNSRQNSTKSEYRRRRSVSFNREPENRKHQKSRSPSCLHLNRTTPEERSSFSRKYHRSKSASRETKNVTKYSSRDQDNAAIRMTYDCDKTHYRSRSKKTKKSKEVKRKKRNRSKS